MRSESDQGPHDAGSAGYCNAFGLLLLVHFGGVGSESFVQMFHDLTSFLRGHSELLC